MNKYDALLILGLTGKVSNNDIKLAYRRKAAEFHPDRNPTGAEIMKMINAAYELVQNEDQIEVFANATMAQYPAELSAALMAIKGLGLFIEVCGLWVWVSGETKLHKDNLKSAGYHWSNPKKMWYYRPEQHKSKKHDGTTWSMDKIRESFGTVKVEEQTHYLAA